MKQPAGLGEHPSGNRICPYKFLIALNFALTESTECEVPCTGPLIGPQRFGMRDSGFICPPGTMPMKCLSRRFNILSPMTNRDLLATVEMRLPHFIVKMDSLGYIPGEWP